MGFNFLLNRKKQIDEATAEKAGPSQASAPADTGNTTSTEETGTPTDKKWDDYLQKWVPASEWMSASEHEKQNKRGFGGLKK